MIVYSTGGRIPCDRCKRRHRALIAFEAGRYTEWWLCNACYERIDQACRPLSWPSKHDLQDDGRPGYSHRKP